MGKITLTKEMHAKLLKAERDLTDILPEFDNAEACGIDCMELRRIHAEYMNQIAALKQHYTPLGR
jgi:hypothetical protein